MLKRKAITISDHAIVRYIERKYGLNLDSIRKEIIETVEGAVNIGAASHSVGDVTYCFVKDRNASNGVLVSTVLLRTMNRKPMPNRFEVAP